MFPCWWQLMNLQSNKNLVFSKVNYKQQRLLGNAAPIQSSNLNCGTVERIRALGWEQNGKRWKGAFPRIKKCNLRV